MSHAAQIEFVKRVKSENPDFFKNKKVIEIGERQWLSSRQ